jgi:plastocyanin
VNVLRASAAVLALSLSFYAVGCGDDDKNPVNPGGGGTADEIIDITGQNGANSYSPSPDTIAVGKTVSWHNSDATAHTATSITGTAIGTGTINPGATSAPRAMNTAGTFNYQCTIHPTMTGVLVVQ